MAKKAKIPFVLINEKSQDKAESKIIQVCKKYDIDVIALARYMRILTPNFVFERKGNLERVNQNVIKGLFGMYLEASFTKKIDVKRFDSDLEKLGKQLRMEVNTHHESNLQKNIAVFVTKEPHCLQTLIRGQTKKELKGKIAVVIGTENTLSGMAKKAKLPFVLINEKSQDKAESKIIQVCKKYDIDVIALARYMRILTPNFVWRYPNLSLIHI